MGKYSDYYDSGYILGENVGPYMQSARELFYIEISSRNLKRKTLHLGNGARTQLETISCRREKGVFSSCAPHYWIT